MEMISQFEINEGIDQYLTPMSYWFFSFIKYGILNKNLPDYARVELNLRKEDLYGGRQGKGVNIDTFKGKTGKELRIINQMRV